MGMSLFAVALMGSEGKLIRRLTIMPWCCPPQVGANCTYRRKLKPQGANACGGRLGLGARALCPPRVWARPVYTGGETVFPGHGAGHGEGRNALPPDVCREPSASPGGPSGQNRDTFVFVDTREKVPRNFYIKYEDVVKHGKTSTCAGC